MTSDHVEPPGDSDFAPAAEGLEPRPHDQLRQDLAQALGITPGEADEWIAERGAGAAESRINAAWTDRGFYRSGGSDGE